MWKIAFWKAVAERAVKSAAQGVVLLAVGDGVFDAFKFDWERALGVGIGAALLSTLTSLASSAVGNNGPSLTSAEVLAVPAPVAV